jgi:hypothetical protein
MPLIWGRKKMRARPGSRDHPCRGRRFDATLEPWAATGPGRRDGAGCARPRSPGTAASATAALAMPRPSTTPSRRYERHVRPVQPDRASSRQCRSRLASSLAAWHCSGFWCTARGRCGNTCGCEVCGWHGTATLAHGWRTPTICGACSRKHSTAGGSTGGSNDGGSIDSGGSSDGPALPLTAALPRRTQNQRSQGATNRSDREPFLERIIQAWPSPGKGRPATGSTNATHPSQMRDTAAGRAETGGDGPDVGGIVTRGPPLTPVTVRPERGRAQT